MDDYVSKPIDPDTLRLTILNLRLKPPEQNLIDDERSTQLLRPEITVEPSSNGPRVTIDCDGLLARSGGSVKVIDMVTQEILRQLPLTLERLSKAVQGREQAELKNAAHAFRGMVANFGATELTEPLKTLEHLDLTLNAGQADELLAGVVTLTEEFKRAIQG
jgi:HPt (histidine-containing phosphotransfer) domain-containing protein